MQLEHGGIAHLIPRDLDRLDMVLEQTELGHALVTTPPQTLYDLLMKPNQGGEPQTARDAADNLIPRVTETEFQDIVAGTQRANGAVRDVLRRLGRQHV